MYTCEDVWSHATWPAGPPKDAEPTIPKKSFVRLIGQPYVDGKYIWQSILYRNRPYEIWQHLLDNVPPGQELQEIEFTVGDKR